MSKIYSEAIADAKKIREIAEENAKKAILESVTPRIRQFIEESILEQEAENIEEADPELLSGNEEDKDDDSQADEVELDEDALNALLEMMGLDKLEEADNIIKDLSNEDKETINTVLNKTKNESKNTDESINSTRRKKELNNMSRKDNETYYEVDLAALREAVELTEKEDHEDHDADEGYGSDHGVDEMMYEEEEAELPDLDALEDLAGSEDEPGGEGAMISKDDIERELEQLIADLGLDIGAEEPEEAPPEEELEGLEEDLHGLEEELEEQLDEVFEVDPKMLRQELARARRLIEGNVDHHFGGKGEGKVGVKNAFGGKGSGKVGSKKAFGGGTEGQDPFVNPPQINKLSEAIRNLRQQNKSQKSKLSKYAGAIQSLREQLEELNLFNAKLLFVNKLLQNKNLTESDKKNVIKSLDSAQSLREAKLVYKSMTETLGESRRSKMNENRLFGSSSRTTTSSSPTGQTTEVNRWAKLAGLTKK